MSTSAWEGSSRSHRVHIRTDGARPSVNPVTSGAWERRTGDFVGGGGLDARLRRPEIRNIAFLASVLTERVYWSSFKATFRAFPWIFASAAWSVLIMTTTPTFLMGSKTRVDRNPSSWPPCITICCPL